MRSTAESPLERHRATIPGDTSDVVPARTVHTWSSCARRGKYKNESGHSAKELTLANRSFSSYSGVTSRGVSVPHCLDQSMWTCNLVGILNASATRTTEPIYGVAVIIDGISIHSVCCACPTRNVVVEVVTPTGRCANVSAGNIRCYI